MPNPTTTKQLPTTSAAMDRWTVCEVNYEYDNGREWFEPVLAPAAGGKSWVYMLMDAESSANPDAECIISVTANNFQTAPGFRSMRHVGFLDKQGKDRFEDICEQVNREGKVEGGVKELKKKFWDMVEKAGILLGQKGGSSAPRAPQGSAKQ